MALQFAPNRAPAPVAETDANIAVRIELTRPLTGHSGPVQVLNLREPTMGDFVDCGSLTRNIAHDPRVLGDMKIEVAHDHLALLRWMTRLTGHGEVVLRQMGARDAAAVKREIERLVAEFEQGNSPSAPPL